MHLPHMIPQLIPPRKRISSISLAPLARRHTAPVLRLSRRMQCVVVPSQLRLPVEGLADALGLEAAKFAVVVEGADHDVGIVDGVVLGCVGVVFQLGRVAFGCSCGRAHPGTPLFGRWFIVWSGRVLEWRDRSDLQQIKTRHACSDLKVPNRRSAAVVVSLLSTGFRTRLGMLVHRPIVAFPLLLVGRSHGVPAHGVACQ